MDWANADRCPTWVRLTLFAALLFTGGAAAQDYPAKSIRSPQQYDSYLRAEIEKWTRVVQHVGIRVD